MGRLSGERQIVVIWDRWRGRWRWRGAGGTFDAEKAGGQHLLSSPILLSVFRFLAVVAVTAKNERNTKESANLRLANNS